MHFTSVGYWLETIAEHDCGGEQLLWSDSAYDRQYGISCMACDARYTVDVATVMRSPPLIRDCLTTSKAKDALLKKLQDDAETTLFGLGVLHWTPPFELPNPTTVNEAIQTVAQWVELQPGEDIPAARRRALPGVGRYMRKHWNILELREECPHERSAIHFILDEAFRTKLLTYWDHLDG